MGPVDRSSHPGRQVSRDVIPGTPEQGGDMHFDSTGKWIPDESMLGPKKSHVDYVNDAAHHRRFGPLGEPGDPSNEHELQIKRAAHWSGIVASGTK